MGILLDIILIILILIILIRIGMLERDVKRLKKEIVALKSYRVRESTASASHLIRY